MAAALVIMIALLTPTKTQADRPVANAQTNQGQVLYSSK
jgi:hypothetical protein